MRVMAESSLSKSDVIVGTPLCWRTSFVLDKFLSNQQEIQQAYPDCSLVLATDEPDFVAELEKEIDHYNLRGEVLVYETLKPDYARSRVWSIACGREAIRQYMLSQGAEYLLCFDSDMLYEPSVISIMKEKIQGFDVVSSGYRLSRYGGWGLGGGCVMLNRKILNKITFRCCEFKNGQVIPEDSMLDIDLFSCRARVKIGVFALIKHYKSREEYYAIAPQSAGWFRTLFNSPVVRYILSRMSILIKYNLYDIAGKLHTLLYRKTKSLSRHHR